MKPNAFFGKPRKSPPRQRLDEAGCDEGVKGHGLLDSPSDIPPAVAQRAVEWLMELQSGNITDARRQAFQHWLSEHADHERAWQRIEAVNRRLEDLGAASRIAHATLSEPHSEKRREAIKALALLLFAGGSAWAVLDGDRRQYWLADERTGVGERRNIRLTDGTYVDLNTDSAISVHFDASERRVRLIRGEILVTTGEGRGDMLPPFRVESDHGDLLPLGTRFMVRHEEDACRVNVFEGAVLIRPRNKTGLTHTLYAGGQLRFTSSSIGEPAPANNLDLAWTDGWLIASGMSLSDFLFELGRHRRGHLSCDPSIAQLRVSGSYPLDDTDRILDILRYTLPIEIHFLTRYWVTVRPRNS